jgi:hypothetical protein
MTSPQAVYQSLYDSDARDVESAFETPAEGMEIQVPYRGSVIDVLRRVRGHLQSAVSYAGENSLEATRKKLLPDPLKYLIPLSDASRRESYER